jgi:hypothetical protein
LIMLASRSSLFSFSTLNGLPRSVVRSKIFTRL